MSHLTICRLGKPKVRGWNLVWAINKIRKNKAREGDEKKNLLTPFILRPSKLVIIRPKYGNFIQGRIWACMRTCPPKGPRFQSTKEGRSKAGKDTMILWMYVNFLLWQVLKIAPKLVHCHSKTLTSMATFYWHQKGKQKLQKATTK